jgi:hypothetical protein
VALKTAWKGQSSCNSGFGAAILRGENVFASDEDPKKKGMLKLASPDALDAWEKKVLALAGAEGRRAGAAQSAEGRPELCQARPQARRGRCRPADRAG